VRNSVRYGYAIGCITAIGIGIGISVHVLYTLVGLGIVIQQSPWFMLILRIAGALYLIYLGWSLLRAPSINIDPSIEEVANTPLSQSKAFMTGFMTNALNPKATIFFLAIFTTLVSPTTPMKVQFAYGVWMCSINALWFMLVAVLFSRPVVRQQFLKMGKQFERLMGLILIALALKLLFTHL
ncbi:MAG: LysE family transporter, partial [Acinetobacter sp.]